MIQMLDNLDFEEAVQSGGLCVMDFFADWCGPCRMMGPVVEALSEEFEDVDFYKVDVDGSPQLAAQYAITSIPSLAFVKNGELLELSLGLTSKEALKEKIEAYL